jgi:hypothetical protein
MAADGSPYDALGIEPGADDSTIEQAYRRLIKQHHPDRLGGDAERAAEINNAYRTLRAERGLKDPLELSEEWSAPRGQGGAWLLLAMLLVAAATLLFLRRDPLGLLPPGFSSLPARPVTAGKHLHGLMDEPLNQSAIDLAVGDAARLKRSSDEMALTSYSRDCQHRLRSHPDLARLDQCAAFDDAVVQLQDRDPLRDQGPFSEIAVTGRAWSGASALSDDSVAIDGRLDRIRLQVELALASADGAASP